MVDPELKKKLSNKAYELGTSLTFHGVNRAIISEYLIQKILWAIVIMASLGYSSLYIIGNVMDFYSYPVITNLRRQYEHNPQFPAITYCYMNDVLLCHFNTTPCGIYNRKKNSICNVFNDGLALGDTGLNEADLLNVKKPGLNHGFYSVLQLSPNTHASFYIHNYTENVDTEKVIRVFPGMETDIVIKRVYESKLPYPYSNCKSAYYFNSFSSIDIINKTVQPYHQSDCFYLCRKRKIANACGFLDEFEESFQYYFTNIGRFTTVVTSNEAACKSDPLKNASKILMEKLEEEFLEKGDIEMCGNECPVECHTVSYDITSYNNFVPDMVSKYGVDNIAIVKIYYEDFYSTRINEIPKINGNQYFANIGGIVSLFLGSSLVSLAEIPDFFFSLTAILVAFMCSKKKL